MDLQYARAKNWKKKLKNQYLNLENIIKKIVKYNKQYVSPKPKITFDHLN